MLHTNPTELLVIGRVVLRIVTRRGLNALARRKHVVRLEDRIVGRRTIAHDATRHAPLAATTSSAALVTLYTPNGPCRTILATVSPESSLRCASDKEIPSSDKGTERTVCNVVEAIDIGILAS